jgi:hypothetical protein
MSTTHSPGPWKLGGGKDGDIGPLHLGVWPESTQPGQPGEPICLISPLEKVTATDEANARLITAAPELLAVAKAVLACGKLAGVDARMGDNDPFAHMVGFALYAISKVEGRSS